MTLNIENTYNIFSIILTLLFSFYMFFNQSKERFGNIFIGFFILFIGLESLEVLLTQTTFYYENPLFYLFITNLAFLVYPAFYFYIKSIAFKGIKLKWIDTIHLIPYLIITTIALFEYHLQPTEVQLNIMTGSDKPYFLGLFNYSIRALGIVYMILSIRIIYRFKTIVKENYSNFNKRNYKWILQLTFVFVYFFISAVIYNLLRFALHDSYNEVIFYITAPINLTFLIWLIYKAMSQPYLFNGVDSNIKLLKEYLIEEEINEGEKDKLTSKKEGAGQANSTDSTVSLSEKVKEKTNTLNSYMAEEEPFLDPSLSIYDLAKQIGMPTKEMSLLINHDLNQHFFDFVNGFRIRKAMEMLVDPSKKEFTVLEILYDVGFNSKSSFNTAFKKYTQLTPTEYRRKYLKSAS